MAVVRTTVVVLALIAGCKSSDRPVVATTGSAAVAPPATGNASAAPPAPAEPAPSQECAAVGKHVADLVTVLPRKADTVPGHLAFFRKRLAPSLAAACEADHWNDKMRACLLRMTALDATQLGACQNPTELASHRDRTADAREDYYRRVLLATALGDPNGPIDPLPVPACASYLDAVNAWLRCDKMPIATRADLLTELEVSLDPGFRTPSRMTADQAAQKCKQHEDSVRTSLAGMGC